MSEDKSPIDDHAAPSASDGDEQGSSKKPLSPEVAALGFVIIALVGFLIVLGIKGGFGNRATSPEDVAALKATVDASRHELNRQRVSMGLSPLADGSEPIDDIAKRLKTDAGTLVALAGRFQEMLEEKDSELTAKNAELLRSEQLRQTLAGENARLNSELGRALAGGSDAERLRADLASLKTQRDAYAAELSSTVEKMKTMSAAGSADDYADLKRRFDETLRAKEFFESRVKELEGDLSKGPAPAR